MSRLPEFEEDEYNLNDELSRKFRDEFQARRANQLAQKSAVKRAKDDVQTFRTEFVTKHKFYSPPHEFALSLLNEKSALQLARWMRGFKVACRVYGLDAQGELFADHIDPGEAKALTDAAA